MRRLFIFSCFILTILPALILASCSDHLDCNSCASQACSWCMTSNKCAQSFELADCDYWETVVDQFDCPIPPRNGFAYDDTFARTKMFPLAAATRASNPQPCVTNALGSGARVKRAISVRCDYTREDTCSGFSGVSDSDRAIFVSFDGTEGDLQFALEIIESFQPKKPFAAGGNVSEYFYNGFYAMWNGGLQDDILTLKAANPTYDLWVTGHSLGGAFASMCAGLVIKLNMWPAEKVKLVTMGQPRTGDVYYAKAHDQLLYYSYRIIHKQDPVAQIPLKFMDWFHHRYEVWYDNDMTTNDSYQICTRPDEDKCSNSKFDLFHFVFSEHLYYFNQEIDNYGRRGCVN